VFPPLSCLDSGQFDDIRGERNQLPRPAGDDQLSVAFELRQGLPLDLLFRIWQLSVSVTKEAASLAFAETKLSINSVLDSPPSMLVQNALDDLKSW
jgi:hypothetical protein